MFVHINKALVGLSHRQRHYTSSIQCAAQSSTMLNLVPLQSLTNAASVLPARLPGTVFRRIFYYYSLEARLQPNIGFIFGAFWRCSVTRLAITPPKVNRFGWNLEYSETQSTPDFWVHCRGLALADFGRDPHSIDSWRARRNFILFF